MLEEIIKLRRSGLSFRRIAAELNTTVGKVQYQWVKYKNDSTNETSEQKTESGTSSSEKETPLSLGERPRYLNDELVAWLIGPEKLLAFWRISDETKSFILNGFQNQRLVLRVYDVTSIIFNGSNAHSLHEIYLPDHQTNWMIKGLKPGRSYMIELGVKRSETKYFSFLRSNAVQIPRNCIDQANVLRQELNHYLNSKNVRPNWIEHVSTYSYYEKMNEMEE